MIEEISAVDSFIDATALLIVRHLKNIYELRNDTGESIGYHSRFMERMFHPESRFFYKGRSKKALEGNDKIRKEHIVPLGYLMDELWEMIEGNQEENIIAGMLKLNLGIATITEAEASRLDGKPLLLKTKMPAGWKLGDDPILRLKTADIVLVDEQGKEIPTLL